jgi:hypothetical protein
MRVLAPVQVCVPNSLQRTLAYLANGDLPPLPAVSPVVLDSLLGFTLSTSACLALGVLIGRGIMS